MIGSLMKSKVCAALSFSQSPQAARPRTTPDPLEDPSPVWLGPALLPHSSPAHNLEPTHWFHFSLRTAVLTSTSSCAGADNARIGSGSLAEPLPFVTEPRDELGTDSPSLNLRQLSSLTGEARGRPTDFPVSTNLRFAPPFRPRLRPVLPIAKHTRMSRLQTVADIS